MAQSVVDVCNSALQKLGAASITNILDNSREARACNLAYDSNRRSEFRKHYWNFAMKRQILAPDSVAPAFEYAYAFTLPTDCLRIVLPNDAYLDWYLEGRKILTNLASSPFGNSGNFTVSASSAPSAASLNLKYIADVTDASLWDPTFYDMLAISLAIDMCETLTQSNKKKEDLNAEYRATSIEARLADAFESLPQDPPDDSWILVRL